MTPTAAAKKHLNMTEADVIDLIKTEQGNRSIRAFAEELGVGPAYISDIYNGKRHPGAKVLDYFGIGKTRRTIVEYTFFRK